MLDFLLISTRAVKNGVTEVYPKLIIKKSTDLMIRGGDFYAIWCDDLGLWATDEQIALQLIDRELDIFVEHNKGKFEGNIKVLHMWDAESGMIDRWHRYCQKQMRDNYHMLDEKLIFANDAPNKEDYASKRLPYALESGPHEAFDHLLDVLYSDEERHKIEWAIGAVVSGDSKYIQKFMVFYGSAGTGKSTILNIIQLLFEGYYSVFDAKALGSSNNAFALEAFKTNPLVAIQHDGDLSRIEDNTRLNSLVSHEEMTVNEKFKSTYTNSFKAFLFMGTNKPVRITDAKSGLIRRLIDVTPSGNRLSTDDYIRTTKHVTFELGAIADHCKSVYLNDPNYYNDYIPTSMMGASNDFYNYMLDSYPVFDRQGYTTLKAAWVMYKDYCDDANVPYPLSQRVFKEELRSYFKDYKERYTLDDGTRVRSCYVGFDISRFGSDFPEEVPDTDIPDDPLIVFDGTSSAFDKLAQTYDAQYASESGTPRTCWDNCTTKLSDIDTSKLHYVRVPENHIVIDFDIPNKEGEKDYELNLKAASKWPPTYSELSKSGKGIHLHYIYSGDASELSRIFDDHIEIKVFTGKSSLRRKLTKYNSLDISTISSGLPMKGDKQLIDKDIVVTERGLRTIIKRSIQKEYQPGTKPSMDFIKKVLDEAYESEVSYDVRDLMSSVYIFATKSTHHKDYCVDLMDTMHFASDDILDDGKPNGSTDEVVPVFYDVEVFPNLFVICYKTDGGSNTVKLINPTPVQVEELCEFPLVGFNCRRYDNHILYARLMGYSNEQLYNLSKRIVSGDKGAFFREAYNLSYTDIYDFASAGNKKSLKKLEIDMGIHHQELGLSWEDPVDEKNWEKVADYCINDVEATEAAFHYLDSDWSARKILAAIAEMPVNSSTNSLTTRIIFDRNRRPQNEFNYYFMGDIPENAAELGWTQLNDDAQMVPYDGTSYSVFDPDGRPYFPGYTFEYGKSYYRDELVGEGGYVYSEPACHTNIALDDIASMHPSSIIAMQLFGPRYTKKYQDIVQIRLHIKHGEYDKVKTMWDGKLAPYLGSPDEAKSLANALKTAINSVYGLTSASFDNPFKDPRNIDNIVAKRGALFMINLKHEVQKHGFTVAHIKTDSIKIPGATSEILKFVDDYGSYYGYKFEHEATYSKLCLVNDAVYIAKHLDGNTCKNMYGYIPGDNAKKGTSWTATGKQFQVPYVFKSLFSKEPIEFEDLCETKAATTALYLAKDVDKPDDYIFVGKVGQFCPMDEAYGRTLLRQGQDKDGEYKYSAPSGTKGYLWMESEVVKKSGYEDFIDKSYFNALASDAIETIGKYCDFDWFVDDIPFDETV